MSVLGSHLYERVGEAPGRDGPGLPGRVLVVGAQVVGRPPGLMVPLPPHQALGDGGVSQSDTF